MKTLRMFGLALLVVSLCVSLNSCTKGITEDIPIQNGGKTYEVQLNLGGEFVEISETPLVRSDTSHQYYAVEIYCMKNDGSDSNYSYYAAGVFDNVEAMKITLLGGYKYKFICTSACDGEDKFTIEYDQLYWLYNSNIRIERINNFYTDNPYLVNNIHLGATEYLKYTNNSYTSDYRSYPRMDRYYGELIDYIPTEGGIATISMKRCVFGVNLIINGVPDGTLSWNSAKTDNYTDYHIEKPWFNFGTYSHTGSEILECSAIYTFYRVRECWEKAVSGEDYSEVFTLNFTWERANGYRQEFSQEFTVKRNTMTTLNVSLTGGSADIGLGFDEENSDMTNENVNVVYDGGSTNDTNIEPEE